jgi:hypothetical protein
MVFLVKWKARTNTGRAKRDKLNILELKLYFLPYMIKFIINKSITSYQSVYVAASIRYL